MPSNPTGALEKFNTLILSLTPESSSSRWLFKTSVHICVLSCKLGRTDHLGEMLDTLFSSMASATRNEASEGLNEVMDAVCRYPIFPLIRSPSSTHSRRCPPTASRQCTRGSSVACGNSVLPPSVCGSQPQQNSLAFIWTISPRAQRIQVVSANSKHC